MQEHGEGDQTIMQCIFLGAAAVGKSTVLKRLLCEKVDIASQTGTQIAEKSVVSRAIAKVSDLKWLKIDDNAVNCGLIEQMVKKKVSEQAVPVSRYSSNKKGYLVVVKQLS